jgi:hypothetical protein
MLLLCNKINNYHYRIGNLHANFLYPIKKKRKKKFDVNTAIHIIKTFCNVK